MGDKGNSWKQEKNQKMWETENNLSLQKIKLCISATKQAFNSSLIVGTGGEVYEHF